MADYVTVSQVKADMVDSALYTSVDYDQAIGEMITNASRLIDREVGGWPNYFYPTTDDETRYFDGEGGGEVWVDPMVNLTSLYVAEQGGRAITDYTAWTQDTHFYVWPYNYATIGQPIQRLVVESDGNKGNFPSARKAIKLTGVFGYSATPPEPIRQACKITALRWFMRAKQGYQDASASVAMGEMVYVKSLDPDVKALLWPYKIGNLV